MNNKVLSQLPVILQTDTQKKFFDATFEQLFQKKQADTEIGWIGRREGGRYDPQRDYFLTEETPMRNNYQLEPVAYTKDPDTLDETNVMFYDDMLKYLSQHKGIVDNHDRLFKTNKYSFAPPIDADKFINYQNYIWLQNGLTSIELDAAIFTTDIEGEIEYEIDTDFMLSSGMHLTIQGLEYIAEGVGTCINLVPLPQQILPFDQFELLPYDNSAEPWDSLPWEAVFVGLPYDYITIERGARDNNGWSRTNRWYHRKVVFDVLSYLGESPQDYTVGERPIIEFKKDIEFYKSGLVFKQWINYAETELTYTDIHTKDVTTVDIDGADLTDGDIILVDATLYDVSLNVGLLSTTIILDEITTAVEDEIIIVRRGEHNIGKTYYYTGGAWMEATVQKTGINVQPLYNLYDTNGYRLDDEIEFPFPSFEGNEIFSYKVNENSPVDDAILGFPLEYSGLGQVGDIVFEHDLETNRAGWSQPVSTAADEIEGFYYFNQFTKDCETGDYSDNYKTTWEITTTDGNIEENKQRVINRYVVTEDGNNTFKISQTTDDLIVKVNGSRLQDSEVTIVDSEVIIPSTTLVDDVIEFYSYNEFDTSDATGYYEIPEALENNPTNNEVLEYSQNDMYKHFLSIIENQDGFTGTALGLDNNYRDTAQDMSKGDYILQTRDPILLPMLSSSSTNLDIIAAMRFSAQEYTRYKNKFIKMSLQVASERDSLPVSTDKIQISQLFSEVIDRLNNSTEFDEAFKYSYMFNYGSAYVQEEFTAIAETTFTLASTEEDITDIKNNLYVYADDVLQLVDHDYDIIATSPIEIEFKNAITGTIKARIYPESTPAFIPATPSKLGMYPVYKPEVVTDDSFLNPADVIVGHDGSRTSILARNTGDLINIVADSLMLEFETRIYNGINPTFRNDYQPPLDIADVRSGYFRTTQYNLAEYISIYKQSFTKWSDDVNASWQDNETYDISQWKTWNYNEHDVPGNWKGLYEYYYDTHRPDTHPWEMLGFSQEPEWWETEYTNDYSNSNTAMWNDIKTGTIRQGNRAGTDSRYARPSMTIPVDSFGLLRDPEQIDAAYVNSPNSDNVWKVGDAGPVEAAWKSTEVYPFAICEALFLTRPAQFGSRFWDTADNAQSSIDSTQYISATTLDRKPYSSMLVHGELSNGSIVYKAGYQQWLSDQLAFNALSINTNLGDKVRRLDVKLGHKMGGYTNPTTIQTFLEGTSADSTTNGLLIPTENVQTNIHTSPSIQDYTYSGVAVLAEADGTYRVFGYDFINSTFNIIPRSPTSRKIDVTMGQDDVDFTIFDRNKAYTKNDIVKYNTVYYSAIESHSAAKFSDDDWKKLKELPSNGGISVSYKPDAGTTVETVPYGTVFKNEQAIFDFLIGYGDYLEAKGWVFETYDYENTETLDWYSSAKSFIFWASVNWAANSMIRLSPASTFAKLNIARGYAGDLNVKYNGVYGLLDGSAVPIQTKDAIIDREDNMISVAPTVPEEIGIYLMRVYSVETEHRVTFDNRTSFADVVYDPLLGVRQHRLKFIGPRTLEWTGKREAPGYVITDDNKLLPNFDTLVESIRRFHDTESRLDRQVVEDTARHLIGFESKPYLVDLDIRQDTQYQFYQGMIRQKGTVSSIDKILRSRQIVDEQSIEVFEEFALRLGEFGATCTTQHLDLVIDPTQVKTNPQVVELILPSDKIGSVKEIYITNAEVVYSPYTIGEFIDSLEVEIVIPATTTPFDLSLLTLGDSVTGMSSGFDGTLIAIGTTSIVIQKTNGTPIDTIQYNELLTIGSESTEATSFSVIAAQGDVPIVTIVPKGVDAVYFNNNPTHNATGQAVLDDEGRLAEIVVTYKGQGYTQEPDVYIAYDMWDKYTWGENPFDGCPDRAYAILEYIITPDSLDDDIITIDVDDTTKWLTRPLRGCGNESLWNMEYLEPVFPTAGYAKTDEIDRLYFDADSMVGTSTTDATTVWLGKSPNETWGIYRIINSGVEVTSYTVDGFLLSSDIVNDLAGYIIINSIVYTYTGGGSEPYIISDSNGEVVTNAELPVNSPVYTFISRRYSTYAALVAAETEDSFMKTSDLLFVDNDEQTNNNWSIYTYGNNQEISYGFAGEGFDTAPFSELGGFILFRKQQQPLVDTSLVKNAFIYEQATNDTLELVNIYDPVKGFIPGIAEQNIDIKTHTDPAKYNNAANDTQIELSIRFSKNEVGQTWLDLSSFRYLEYEQGDYQYRRNNWGKLFPGSDLAVYEWIESDDLPVNYTGDGTPYSLTDYTEEVEYDVNARYDITTYYYWVRGRTTWPTHRPNRTMPTATIEQLLNDPNSQGYIWFALIESNKYIMANTEHIFENNEAVFQINYKKTHKDTNAHAEWYLMGEGNRNSAVKDVHWDKFVDSLIGFTKDISTSEIPYIDNLPGSEHIGLDPSDNTEQIFQLAVPNPALSLAERYGTQNRPRQSWFVDNQTARKVFAQSVNELLSDINFIDEAIDFASYTSTNDYWEYATWYADGYDASSLIPDHIIDASSSIPSTDDTGTIYKIEDEQIYYIKTDSSATLIAHGEGTIAIKDTVYEDYRLYTLREELREILTTLKDVVFINNHLVKLNTLFFAMINYVLSEQKDVDWVFKTTYVTLNQEGVALEQTPTLTNNPFESLLSYINEVKPYSTKIRDYKNAFTTFDLANVTVEDSNNKRIKLKFDRVENDPFGWGVVGWGGIIDEEDPSTSPATDILINANGFEEPTIPWGLLPFGEDDWDGLVPVDFYQATTLLPDGFESDADLTPGLLGNDPLFIDMTPLANTVSYDLTNLPITDYSRLAIYINGDQTLNYYIYNDTLYIMQILTVTDEIAMYEISPFTGGNFLQPDVREGVPEELAPIIGHEGVVFNVTTADPALPQPITIEPAANEMVKYRIHVDMTGAMHYERMYDIGAELDGAFVEGDLVITVNDASLLPNATVAEPAAIWIGNERILYSGKDGDDLVGIVRGTRNTIPLDKADETKIWLGDDSENIPNGNLTDTEDELSNYVEIWNNENTSLFDSTTLIASFLQDGP